MFIFLRSDSFDARFRKEGDNPEAQFEEHQGSASIRRPYRGIQIKDETYASLSIFNANNEAVPLFSESDTDYNDPKAGRGKVTRYYDFIIQGVDDTRQEKMQVIETFGDPYVFFYGEKPRFVTFNGLLINTEDFNWRAQFWKNYDRYLRGTKLVQLNARAYLAYDSIVIEGYPVQANATDNAEMPYSVPFSLTMLVTNYLDYTDVGNVNFPEAGLTDSVDVLNKKLLKDKQESKIRSTTADVRLQNLLAAPPGGALNTLRRGMRKVNDIVGSFSRALGSVSDLIGGRAARLPLGIAGYFAAVGDAQIAPGSIDAFAYDAFDATTGNYKTVTGTLKLRVPAPSGFVEPNILRGVFKDNIDEYVQAGRDGLALQPLKYPLSVADQAAVDDRMVKRVAKVTKKSEQLAFWNLKAENGNLLGDIADAVGAVRDNFGMVVSAAALTRQTINDPKGTLLNTFGLGVYQNLGSKTIASYKNLYKYVTGQPRPEEQAYVGSDTTQSFDSRTDELRSSVNLSNPEPTKQDIGASFASYPYASADGSRAYEDVYEDEDLTTAASDAETKALLTEAHGDKGEVNGAPDVGPEEARSFYSNSETNQVWDPITAGQALDSVTNRVSQPSRENTSGIVSVDDADTEIEPVR